MSMLNENCPDSKPDQSNKKKNDSGTFSLSFVLKIPSGVTPGTENYTSIDVCSIKAHFSHLLFFYKRL